MSNDVSSIIFVDAQALLSFYDEGGSHPRVATAFYGFFTIPRYKVATTDVIEQEFRIQRARLIQNLQKSLLSPIPNIQPIHQSFPEANDFTEARNRFEDSRKALISAVKERMNKSGLPGDAALSIFDRDIIEVSQSDVEAARSRKALGLPPQKQKDDSIKDAASWEALLRFGAQRREGISRPVSLSLISGDGDFSGPGDRNTIHPILARNWYVNGGGGQAKLFLSIESYLKSEHPEVYEGANPEDVYWLKRARESIKRNPKSNLSGPLGEVNIVHPSSIDIFLEIIRTISSENLKHQDHLVILADAIVAARSPIWTEKKGSREVEEVRIFLRKVWTMYPDVFKHEP